MSLTASRVPLHAAITADQTHGSSFMTIATEAGIHQVKVKEVSDLVKHAGQKAVKLRIVERFLSEVERRLLKTSPIVFDIERIRAALQILKTIQEDDDIEECLEAEFRLEQEFHLWRDLIIERDKKIETYHFRRLCDSAPYPLDDEIFVALAAFYRELDFTPTSQSKFDLAVTRLFSKMTGPDRREMKAPRSETVTKLRQLLGRGESSAKSEDILRAVSSIDGFTSEANRLNVFEDLVKSNIFDRYRAFKRELGPVFFEAEIVAAAIECNITVGNVFDELLRRADEQLSARLTVDVDLPGALHDASPDSRVHIGELFKVFFGDSEMDKSGETETDYLSKLLTVAGQRPTAQPAGERAAGAASLQDRLAPVLRTLTEARPNAELLTNQLRRVDNAGGVSIGDFLFNSENAPDVLARRVLGLIIWTVEFREHDLNQQKELTETIQRECTALLVKCEHLADKLEAEIESCNEQDRMRLRRVLNCLRDSRLKLERSIVRFTNRKLASTESSPAAAPVKGPARPKQKRSVGSVLFRWTVISLVLTSITAAALYFVNKQFDGVLTSASGFATVDVRTLPQHELIKSAYRHDHTLFINAHDAWKDVSEEERSKALQAVVDDPKFARIQTIVVMGADGDVIESKSRGTVMPNYGSADAANIPNAQ